MGHYSHVLTAGTGTGGTTGTGSGIGTGTGFTSSSSTRAQPRRLRLLDVSVMAMRAEVVTIAFWRAVIAECLASLLLVLFGCLATLACPHSPAPHAPSPASVVSHDPADARTLVVALCFGLTVASLVQSFQHISGAHLNPVVSLVQVLTCKVTPLRALLYALAQCAGAVAGASILHGITTGSCQADLGTTSLHQGLSPWQGMGIEILLTFLLLFTLCVINDPNRVETFTTTTTISSSSSSSSSGVGSSSNKALVVGLTVAGCHLAGYRFTGSSMNPARSLGPAFVAGNWTHHWVYWAGPTLGGIAAGLLYEFIFDPSRTRSRSSHLPASLDAEDGGGGGGGLLVAGTFSSTSLTSPTSSATNTTPSNSSSVPNHYVPGTYGDRSLVDAVVVDHAANNPGPSFPFPRPPSRTHNNNGNSNNSNSNNNSSSSSNSNGNNSIAGSHNNPHNHHNSTNEDLFARVPPVPRRNDVRAVTSYAPPPPPPPPPPPQRRPGGGLLGPSPVDDVSPGRENQAYAFDSNPRRPHPTNNHLPHSQQQHPYHPPPLPPSSSSSASSDSTTTTTTPTTHPTTARTQRRPPSNRKHARHPHPKYPD
ncbi:uncharacterized protein LOC143276885 [Babylonia areolata]|uniref:uncharacterized protein LOC143276885 n=1 Tax=Babylonia areolata TaxID=304850 RepID=UPI003FD34EFB